MLRFCVGHAGGGVALQTTFPLASKPETNVPVGQEKNTSGSHSGRPFAIPTMNSPAGQSIPSPLAICPAMRSDGKQFRPLSSQIWDESAAPVAPLTGSCSINMMPSFGRTSLTSASTKPAVFVVSLMPNAKLSLLRKWISCGSVFESCHCSMLSDTL